MNINVNMDARFALVVAAGAEPLHEPLKPQSQTLWERFLAAIKTPPVETSVESFHENVWLIPLDKGLPHLGKILEMAKQNRVTVRVLFLSEKPKWIEYLPPPR